MRIFLIVLVSISFRLWAQIPGANAHQDDLRHTESVIKFGKIQVAIVQNRRLRGKENDRPLYCNAALFVIASGDTLHRVVFEDIQPLGGNFGIFEASDHPSSRHRAFFKRGDYDGRLILVTKDGELFNIPGGSFRVFAHRWLVSIQETDGDGPFVVFDLLQDRLLPIESKEFVAESGIGLQFYVRGASLFVKKPDSVRPSVPSMYYRIDFANARVIQAEESSLDKAVEWKITTGSDTNAEDCSCPHH